MKLTCLLRKNRPALLILLFCLAPPVSSAPEVLGWLEGAYLQPWGVRVRARLDTGARTSAIHAEHIEIFKKNGADWVKFHFPFGRREGYQQGLDIERPLLRRVHVKKRGGGLAERYVVKLNICISGETNAIELSLVDRSNFNYPIILGRKALAGRYLVDPSRTFLGKRTCPRKIMGSNLTD